MQNKCSLLLGRCNKILKQMKSDLQSESQILQHYETQTVNVFMRNVRKQARLVALQSPAKSTDLTIIASTRFNIPEQRVILFYNGFRIDNYGMPITLTQRSIIHILDKRNLGVIEVAVNFKSISWNMPTLKIVLNPDITIRQMIINHLAPHFNIDQKRFFIVYLGKTLNTSNTLREEYVQDDSELIIIQHQSPKESFQKEALEFNASYHIQNKYQSSLKYNCPVTYVTSIDSLNKKKVQQTNLIQQQNLNLGSHAGPKVGSMGLPFPMPKGPVINDSFINTPFNINISTIKADPGQALEETTAPVEKSSKKQSKKSSEMQRCAPLPQQKSGQPQIGHEDKVKAQNQKAILKLQSSYPGLANAKEKPAFPFPSFINEKDSFIQKNSAKPS